MWTVDIFVEGILYNKYENFLWLSANENGFVYPTIIWHNGTKEWHERRRIEPDFIRIGEKTFHRLHGPAIEYSNGDKEWWFNGKRHRNDGPAVIYGNKQYWFSNGEFKVKVENDN